MSKSKKIKAICNNCRLYDPHAGICNVVILHEGKRVRIPVDGPDPCFFEQTYFDPITKTTETFNEVKEVKFWVEDEKGQKTNKNGTVKMEYEEGFFGKININDIV